ncbi:MAG: threonine/serine exporter family protein [Myxococcales bacterium]|nr:threonine/serine exporter family protein [Myxococcales bacterium]
MARTETLSAQEALEYVVELGSALMSAGCPTHRLEELLDSVAKAQGFSADVFAVPTGLFVTLRGAEGTPPVFSMARVSTWSTDLHLLGQLDEVVTDVASGVLSIPEARARIRALKQAPPLWGRGAKVLAGMGASAGSVVSLGGSSWTDSLLAGVGGGLLALLLTSPRRQPGVRVLENFLGGLLAGLVAMAATLVWPGHARDALVLAIIIPLLPGLVLTTGLAELTYRNLVAGSSRLFHAGVTLLSLVFGIGAVVTLEAKLGLSPGAAAPREAAGLLWNLAALGLSSVSYGVLLGLSRKELGVAVGSCAFVWVSTWLSRYFLVDLAIFAVAFALAAAANAYARITSRPAQLFLMPGMLLLVPGVVGFRGLDALLRGDVAAGSAQLADLLLVSGALVTGLLVANVVVPPEKTL